MNGNVIPNSQRIADGDSRWQNQERMREESSLGPAAVIAVVVVALAAAAVWYWQQEPASEAPPPPEAAVSPPPEAITGPAYPLPQMPATEDPGALAALPPLSDSDRYFELELGAILGSGVVDLLINEALIQNIVATIDNLPRQTVAERIRPVGRLDEPLLADGQDGSDEFLLSPSSYDRFTPYAVMLSRADRDELVAVYRRFYPLFQEAYVGLGYPNGYFNDRLVEVIDHLLDTPNADQPVRLVRPHVLYEFADPELQTLSAGQKLMIRAGPENAVLLRQFLEEVRERIVVADANR